MVTFFPRQSSHLFSRIKNLAADVFFSHKNVVRAKKNSHPVRARRDATGLLISFAEGKLKKEFERGIIVVAEWCVTNLSMISPYLFPHQTAA